MLDTQWRMLVVPIGTGVRLVRTGLDYVAADLMLRQLGLPEGTFADLQAMESAALEAYAEMVR